MSGGNGESPPVNVGVRQQDQTIMIYNSRTVCELLSVAGIIYTTQVIANGRLL